MKVIDRIYQYIAHLDISVRVFEAEAKIGNGYLAKMKASKGSVGTEVLSKIVTAYPFLNIDWLITGTGEMLKKPTETTAVNDGDEYSLQFKLNELNKRIAVMQELIDLQKDNIALLKEKLNDRQQQGSKADVVTN